MPFSPLPWRRWAIRPPRRRTLRRRCGWTRAFRQNAIWQRCITGRTATVSTIVRRYARPDYRNRLAKRYLRGSRGCLNSGGEKRWARAASARRVLADGRSEVSFLAIDFAIGGQLRWLLSAAD